MASRELVGRPLVPFFDADDNVNTSLDADLSTQVDEQMDIDARVWDKELGYFVYPTEKPAPSSSHGSRPIAIAPRSASPGIAGNPSVNKLLLTPDMLSRSAPDATLPSYMMLGDRGEQKPTDASGRTTPRSSSAKRASRQKSRSNTPNKSKKEGGGPNETQTKSNNKMPPSPAKDNGSTTATNGANKKKKGGKEKEKPKEDLSTATGKWAWSAFQSSPDPKSLPLPPMFGANGLTSLDASGAAPPPPLADPPVPNERSRPPPGPPERRGPPSPPPLPPTAPLPPTSIEHSMTQDLRRMLNIGGV